MKTRLNTMLAVMTISAFTATMFISCDTPQTIAWSYYHCAEDAMKAGDLQKAKEYLQGVAKGRDSQLDTKVDSLMNVIDQALAAES